MWEGESGRLDPGENWSYESTVREDSSDLSVLWSWGSPVSQIGTCIWASNTLNGIHCMQAVPWMGHDLGEDISQGEAQKARSTRTWLLRGFV